MLRRLLLSGSLLALALVPVPLAAQASSTPPTASAASCVYGRIDGKTKCLRRGEYCVHKAKEEREYLHYGFRCNNEDDRGDWHLT